MARTVPVTRRTLLGGAAALAVPALGAAPLRAQGTQTLTLQLGWLANHQQLGEVVAKRLGYFEQERINFVVSPGGPNIDGLSIVASGRAQVGQISSSPSMLLAASQGIPVRCIAAGAQIHPFTYYSLPRAPVRSPRDMIGKRVGTPPSARVLLSALLRRHAIPENQVQVVPVGVDVTPLMTGQVECVTGWETTPGQGRILGPETIRMRLWDQGVRLYALCYYATAETIERRPELLTGYVRATARGWAYALENIDRAIDLLVQEYPNFNRDAELEATRLLLTYIFTQTTRAAGWGTFDPAVWQEQIDLFDQLGQFTAGKPRLDAVMTPAILEATAAVRPRA